MPVQVEAIEVLLEAGASPAEADAKQDTALHYAAWAGNAEAIAVLVAKDTQQLRAVNRRGLVPQQCAEAKGHGAAAQALQEAAERAGLPPLDAEEEEEEEGQGPSHSRQAAPDPAAVAALCAAAAAGEAAALAQFLEAAPVDAQDGEGDAALHHAAKAGQLEAVQALLAAGAEPNLQNHAGQSPLHWWVVLAG